MNKETTFCVYMHTVLSNGKVYIGITSQKPKYRWGASGGKYKKCPFFFKAINKHGWDNIKHEVISFNLKKDEAELLEVNLIAKYNSSNPKYGYNILPGGKLGTVGVTVTQETREKLRKYNLGRKTNKPMPINTRIGIDNNRWKTKKKIIQIDKVTHETIKIWEGGIDIERAGIALNTNVIKCCKGIVGSAKGFIWKYYE